MFRENEPTKIGEVSKNLTVQPGETQALTGVTVKAGTGAQPVGSCRTCGGKGVYTTHEFEEPSEEVCPDCEGTGIKVEEPYKMHESEPMPSLKEIVSKTLRKDGLIK